MHVEGCCLVDQPLLYVAALVAYDGTDFHGFQLQPNAPTVQAALETALQLCTGEKCRVVGSGRTDTGVHANGQVVAVQVPWRHSLSDLQRAWNAHLPAAIAVRRVRLAPARFHPRFSALHRTYRYTLFDQPSASAEGPLPRHLPLVERFALYVRQELDWEAMNVAAQYLVGEHDFATFGHPPQGEQTVRQLYHAEWQVVQANLLPFDDYVGRQLVFTVTANAFLRQMVRNLVGTLLAVGSKQWTPDAVRVALEAKDRRHCKPPVPPHGLVLEKVFYPPPFDLW